MGKSLIFSFFISLCFVGNIIAQSDGYNGNGFNTRLKISSEDAAAMGIYKMSLTDNFVKLMRRYQKYQPKTYFDRNVTGNCLSHVTNWYLSELCPYDTCWESDKYKEENERRAEEHFKGVDLDEYERDFVMELQQDDRIMRIRRGDFWEELFEINREIANPVGFALIEKSIREIHSALGLEWGDTIFMEKHMLERHRAVVEEIFLKETEKINKRYIR